MSPEAVYALDIVCTDKDTHDEVWITTLRMFEDGRAEFGQGSDSNRGGFAVPDDLSAFEQRQDGRSWEVFGAWCATCNRTPELRPERFRHLVLSLKDAGVSRLDISRLPF